MKVSVVLSVYNEESNIKAALESVIWADEIIVVDNQSSDDTVDLVKQFTNKIYSRKNNPQMLNLNKNYGFTKASNDWILSLDADERVSEELKEEIKEELNSAAKGAVGYLIPRKNIIFGKWIKHGLWHPDHQLRLFRKGSGKFPGKHNHELIEVDGKTAILDNYIIHHNYTSVNQYLNKITYYYSDNEVEQFIKSGKTINWYDAIRMPISDFLTNYFARSGYKDGLHGLVLALLQAFYSMIVFVKIWEKQGFWEYDNEEFLKETYNEFELKAKEIIFWTKKASIAKAPGYKKLLLKLKDKFLS